MRKTKILLILAILLPSGLSGQEAVYDYYDAALAGKTAGVLVSLPDGLPGRTADILVRGTGSAILGVSPLFVIDGMIADSSMADLLSAAQIESVEILKDASALALYGARGANGVVLVTTRNASTQGLKVNADVHWGLSSLGRNAPALDGAYFADKVVRVAPLQSYDVQVAGGNEKSGSSFNLDFSALDNKGILRNTGFGRYNARMHYGQKLSEKLSFDFGGYYASGIRTGLDPTQSLMPGEGYQGYLMYDILSCTSSDNPVDASVDRSTDWRFNPVTTLQNYEGRLRSTVFNVDFGAEYALAKSVVAKTSVIYNIRKSDKTEFLNSKTPSGSPGSASGTGISASDLNSESDGLIAGLTLSWKPRLSAGHELKADAVLSYETLSGSSGGEKAINITTESLGIYGMNMGTYVPVDFRTMKWNLLSFGGTARYAYKERYELGVSLRADGFAGVLHNSREYDRTYSLHPGVSAAWNIGRESFAAGLDWLSSARIKASWAIVGNTCFDIPFDELFARELTSQFDFGLEASLFDHRLGVELAYFDKTCRDAVVPDALSPGVWICNGNVSNSGMEFGLKGTPVSGPELKWDIYCNASFAKSELPEVNEYHGKFEPFPSMFGGFGTQVRAGRFDAGAEFVFRSGCEVLNLLSNEVEDGSFVRLNALYAGYTIKNARLFLQAGNLFVISAYKGYDPEVSSLGHSAPGIDCSSYPRALTLSTGLKISF